jgi:hypothetical protein
MPKGNHHIKFSDLELLILRVASLAFLILMILKVFKAELASW